MDPLDGLRRDCSSLAIHSDEQLLEADRLDAMRPSRGRPEFAERAVRPLGIAEPAIAAEVSALVRWAGANAVPLVPRGGGSGLMGGAAVLRPAIVIDLRRMNAVRVDPDACVVHAGAGAVLAHVDAALAEHGLMLGHDPWTFEVATVGGVIGTNGLGYLGARAGSVTAQVQALEAVLSDGRIVRTPTAPARSTGLDIARLMIGTEGTLGIVTEATIAVLPRPEERIPALYRLPSFAAGVSAAAKLRRTGVRYSCLELSAEGLSPSSASLLLVFDGLRGEARLHAERARDLVRAEGGETLPSTDAAHQWDQRHAIAERWAARRRSRAPDWLDGGEQFDYAHVGVPLAGLDGVRASAHALVRQHDLTLIDEGLWHWPELYSVVVHGPAGSAAGVRATIDGICRAAQDAGGTMEYCHGVGWQLAHLMDREHGPAGLDVLRRVKAALDPKGILNPGKEL
jgi:glycolate oxidase